MTEGRSMAVVTGASSGIGRALAEELADRGFDLVVSAEDAELDEAAQGLRGRGAEVVAVRSDLATAAGVDELAAAVRATGRPVEALLINAGVGVNGSFVESSLADHLRLVDLNVRSAVHLAGELLPAMVARGEGRVMFTSSIAATMPGTYQSTYNASKAFLLLFSQAIGEELSDSGVTVTALMPGPTDTEFFERADMEDTKLGQAKKDDAAEVAKDGLEAMFAGEAKVVAGSPKNRAQTAAAKVLPDKAVAKAHSAMAKPGSGSDSD